MPTYYEDPSSLTRVVEYEVPADDVQAKGAITPSASARRWTRFWIGRWAAGGSR